MFSYYFITNCFGGSFCSEIRNKLSQNDIDGEGEVRSCCNFDYMKDIIYGNVKLYNLKNINEYFFVYLLNLPLKRVEACLFERVSQVESLNFNLLTKNKKYHFFC